MEPMFIVGLFFGVVFGMVGSYFVKRIFLKPKRSTKEMRWGVVKSVDDTPSLPPTPQKKPQNLYSDYTIEELESSKKHLENDYAHYVHYPYARLDAANRLKMVLELISWHYDQNGTREFMEQRDKTRQELADFEKRYQAALKATQK